MSEEVSHTEILLQIKEEKSEEVNDILDRIPSTFSLVITSFLLFVVGVVFLLGFIIDYPDVVMGDATLSSSQPAVRVVMPSSGKINFNNIKQKQYVQEGQLLAVVNNPASTKDVFRLKEILNSFNPMIVYSSQTDFSLPKNLVLGEVGVAYFQFKNSFELLNYSVKHNLYQQQIRQMELMLKEEEQNLSHTREISETLSQNLFLVKKSITRDSTLLASSIISEDAFEQSLENYLQTKRVFQLGESDILKVHSSISSLTGNIERLKIEEGIRFIELKMQMVTSYTNLYARVEAWERVYTLLAPASGQVEFLQFWNSSQYIPSDTEVLSIIPRANLSKVEVVLPSDGVGKVRQGHKVFVRLEDYPSKEYGYLEGIVSAISLTKLSTEDANLTLVDVELVNNNVTNYGLELELKYGMKSTIEIVTEDKKLITRLFERVRYIF